MKIVYNASSAYAKHTIQAKYVHVIQVKAGCFSLCSIKCNWSKCLFS